MITRLLTKEDTSAAKKLWGYAFETDEPFYTWYFQEVFNPKNSIGIFSEGELVSYLQLNPYTIYLNGNSFKASYVVGVITSPEYRNKGAMKVLLSKAIEEMNKRNHFVSILMPFDTTFYRPYGWELCYSQMKYETPIYIVGHYSNQEKGGTFSRINLDKDFESLNNIYETYLKHHHGYVKRNKKNWDHILKDLAYYNGHAYLLKDSKNLPVGYILYFIKNGKFTAKEIVYKNEWAKKSLFGFIYSHKSQATTVEWSAPSNDSTHLFLKDTIQPKPTNKVSLYPFMCGRIINIKKALESCLFSKSICCSFSMEITDSYAPWNDGTFIVTIQNGKASLEKTDLSSVDLSCTINTFSQLFFGAINIDQAISLEKIILHNQSILENLSKIFYSKNNYINEFF
ncbi:GNAT family N-acetyltransferase [Crassaminicella thermophila]|uniref:GNAT family N-acetyltransferase n=1 Tax=Crassaminicella thermophila TaxID=2599308 RepID=A0A5C0SG19_CRATE|nr:GNAT family N-acetyltransferase [Crassaminicella thermophila]QEK13301.1 GNAT family N-acetyltransferase [Crassaminicella thermophila]